MKEILEKLTYPVFLGRLRERFGERAAISDKERTLTYNELFSRSDSLAAYFISRGIANRDNVMVQLDNSVLFAECVFALLRIGAVPVLIYPACRENEVSTISSMTQPAAFISFRVSKGYDNTVTARNVCENTPSIKNMFFADELEAEKLESYILNENDIASPEYDETALIILSGGSTGVPKLIARKHAEHIRTARLCAESCGLDESSVFLLSMPAAHNFNFAGPGLIGTLAFGGEVVMCRTSVPSEIVSLIGANGVTATALVPSLSIECIAYAKKNGMTEAFKSLRTVQLGGAVCPSSTVESVYSEMECIPQQIYGMGEGILFATHPDDPLDIISAYQGVNLSRFDTVRIIDEDGKDVPEGEYGELIAKGPSIITEYYNDPISNSKKFTEDGFYKTGDRAKLDDGKYLHVAGRIDDMINKGGEKIYPPEIEGYINKCSDVDSSVVIGVDDASLGQIVCAFVISENSKATETGIRNELSASGTAAFKIPDRIFFIDQWPLTSVKKIDKKALKAMAAEKISSSEADADIIPDTNGMDETEAEIAVIWARLLKTSEISKSSSFIELGGNSLMISTMLEEIYGRFSVYVGIEEFYSAHDLAELADIVKQRGVNG